MRGRSRAGTGEEGRLWILSSTITSPLLFRLDPNICDVVMKKQYATSKQRDEKIKQV